MIGSTALPPAESNVMVYWLIDHWAVSARSSATGVAKSNAVSAPSANQPRNVQPSNSGSAGFSAAESFAIFCAAGAGETFASANVTVTAGWTTQAPPSDTVT